MMDASESQECCHSPIHLQNGETAEEELLQENKTCDGQVQNNSPTGPGNLKSYHEGDCSASIVSSTRHLDTAACNKNGNVEGHDTSQRTQKNSWSLVTLPPELILVVFSYLDARFTLRVLTCVCRLFCNLLSPESSWKTRFGKQWPRRDNREDYNYISRFVPFSVVLFLFQQNYVGSINPYYSLTQPYYSPTQPYYSPTQLYTALHSPTQLYAVLRSPTEPYTALHSSTTALL